MSKTADLKRLGREWAWLAIRHQCQPTTTGNVEHDQACAQEYLRKTGNPPSWYTKERFGPIYPDGHPACLYPWEPR